MSDYEKPSQKVAEFSDEKGNKWKVTFTGNRSLWLCNGKKVDQREVPKSVVFTALENARASDVG